MKKETPNGTSAGKNNFFNILKVGIAATIMLLVGIGIFIKFFNNHHTYKTALGEVQTITLHDGSRIFLNAGSEQRVPDKFAETTRFVWLEGEGFFEVAKDSLHPFIVETEKTRTEVLGTKFNMSAYANEAVILTLNEKKVF